MVLSPELGAMGSNERLTSTPPSAVMACGELCIGMGSNRSVEGDWTPVGASEGTAVAGPGVSGILTRGVAGLLEGAKSCLAPL